MFQVQVMTLIVLIFLPIASRLGLPPSTARLFSQLVRTSTLKTARMSESAIDIMTPSSVDIPPTMDDQNDDEERTVVTASDEKSGIEYDEEEDGEDPLSSSIHVDQIIYDEDEHIVQSEIEGGNAISFQTCEVGLSFEDMEHNFSNYIGNRQQQRQRNHYHLSFLENEEAVQNVGKRRRSSNNGSFYEANQRITSKIFTPVPDSLKRLKLLNPVDLIRDIFEQGFQKRKNNAKEKNRRDTTNLEQLLSMQGAYDKKKCPVQFETSHPRDKQDVVAKTIRNCDVDTLRHLYSKQGISMKCQNKIGEGPLHWACRMNDIEKVSFLLNESDAILRIRHDGGGLTPFHEACSVDQTGMLNLNVLEKLIQHDPLLLLVPDDSGNLPLAHVSRKFWPMLYDFLEERRSMLSSF